MPNAQAPVFARPDTIFGVCEALGQDFGFNPLYLRVTLGVLILWNPVAVLGIYAFAGVAVAVSRLLVPNKRHGEVERPAAIQIAARKPVIANEEPELALAA